MRREAALRSAVVGAMAVLMLADPAAFAAEPVELQPFAFLIGEWPASGSGQAGAGSGTAVFSRSLQDRVILRTSYAEDPPADGKVGSRHDDLMIIYVGPGGGVRADYHDNEGHIIRYSGGSPATGEAVFLSEATESEPRFRLSYRLEPDGALAGEFAISPPGASAAFRPYLAWRSRKAAAIGLSNLTATPTIDSDNPRIVETMRRVTEGRSSPLDRVRALYELVRDGSTDADCASYTASAVLDCGGNSCYQRSILLAALARAAGIPSRLHLQRVKIKAWRSGDKPPRDIVFAHGITGVFVDGRWRLLEVVGNPRKWVLWTGESRRAGEMPLPFSTDGDTLLPSDDRITIETLPESFADRTPEMIALIESLNDF